MFSMAREGQVFGPYSLAELRGYVATGRVVATDIARTEAMDEWLPVAQLLPELFTATRAGGLPRMYPNPPDLPWWVALLLGLVTGGVFFVVWDVVLAAWLRKVERGSTALTLYFVCAVLYLFRLPSIWYTVDYNVFNGPVYVSHLPGIGLASLVLAIAARFVFRRELLMHFNGPEPIGLRLSGLWTLLFGGLYFQFHFNRINELKRALGVSVAG
jgi:hypothetical protein